MRIMDTQGTCWHLFPSNSNKQFKHSGETTSSASGKKQKQKQPLILGISLPLSFKPLGKYTTQKIQDRVKFLEKGIRRKCSVSHVMIKCCTRVLPLLQLSAHQVAAQMRQLSPVLDSTSTPTMHSSVQSPFIHARKVLWLARPQYQVIPESW